MNTFVEMIFHILKLNWSSFLLFQTLFQDNKDGISQNWSNRGTVLKK
jgi:hypothetical protein